MYIAQYICTQQLIASYNCTLQKYTYMYAVQQSNISHTHYMIMKRPAVKFHAVLNTFFNTLPNLNAKAKQELYILWYIYNISVKNVNVSGSG